jgi:probable rRNA maturation factor
LVEAVRETVLTFGDSADAEITVTVTTDEQMRALNLQYRHVNEPTDVLSFAFDGGTTGPGEMQLPPGSVRQLGDVVVSYPRAADQAERIGHLPEQELAWLTVHGVLQLLGYEHETEADVRRMAERETAVLRKLGIEGVDVTSDRVRH